MKLSRGYITTSHQQHRQTEHRTTEKPAESQVRPADLGERTRLGELHVGEGTIFVHIPHITTCMNFIISKLSLSVTLYHADHG